MNIKKRGIICILLLMSVVFVACKSDNKKIEPVIKATFTFSKLTDKDFKDIGTKDVVKEDFKRVSFILHVNNCTNIDNRIIEIPDLKDIMNAYDIERYWYGENTISDSPGEDALYSYDIMFLSKGLTKENIKSIFNNKKVVIKWENRKGKEVKNTINLSDIMKFN